MGDMPGGLIKSINAKAISIKIGSNQFSARIRNIHAV
jgi:hypothetical protein